MTALNGQNVPRLLGEYLHEVDLIHLNWQKTADRTLSNIVHRKLVLPIRILNRKHKNIELARHSSDLLLQASLQYENLSNLLKAYKEQFVSYSKTFKNDCDQLERSLLCDSEYFYYATADSKINLKQSLSEIWIVFEQDKVTKELAESILSKYSFIGMSDD